MGGSSAPQFVKRLSHSLPDRVYLQLRYFSKFRRFGRFRHPRTYNEKLQWLKLYHRVPGEWRLVDKIEVKAIVADRIGKEHVIPTLGVFDSVAEINFDALPEQFVLKCSHDSGGVVLVRDKRALDRDAALERLQRSMEKNYFYSSREPHYLHIRPRIIAEPYLEDAGHGQLLDYKFFCFDGEVKALFVASDRASGEVKFDYFDADFAPLHIRQPYPNAPVLPTRPDCFDEMLEISRTLSRGHPHVRVDLYEVNGRVYFGELTFYHFGGMEPFHPAEWDRNFGEWLALPRASRPR